MDRIRFFLKALGLAFLGLGIGYVPFDPIPNPDDAPQCPTES